MRPILALLALLVGTTAYAEDYVKFNLSLPTRYSQESYNFTRDSLKRADLNSRFCFALGREFGPLRLELQGRYNEGKRTTIYVSDEAWIDWHSKLSSSQLQLAMAYSLPFDGWSPYFEISAGVARNRTFSSRLAADGEEVDLRFKSKNSLCAGARAGTWITLNPQWQADLSVGGSYLGRFASLSQEVARGELSSEHLITKPLYSLDLSVGIIYRI